MKPNSKLSKFLSLILRHKPEVVGVSLDPQGWAPIDVLIAKCNKTGTRFTRQELLHVVDPTRRSGSPCPTTGSASAQRKVCLLYTSPSPRD